VELGSKLTGVHGGTVAWLNVGRPAPAERWRGEWLASYPVFVRCSCAQKGGEKEDGGARSTERRISGELDQAPVSDYRRLIAYHGDKVLARDARGEGGTQGEMGRSTASWSGRNSQLRRGAGAGGTGGEHVRCCCCCPSEKQMRWRRGRQTRRGGCRRDRRGTGATGVHAVSDDDGVRTRGRRALWLVGHGAAHGSGQRARRQAGPACAAGPKGKRRPAKENKMIFLFIS